jgi:hypothetical protein
MNYIRQNETHMYTECRSAHDNSDVAVYCESLPGSLVGSAECTSSTSRGLICTHWHVKMDSERGPV